MGEQELLKASIEVIQGRYGNGKERQNNLAAKGYNSDEIKEIQQNVDNIYERNGNDPERVNNDLLTNHRDTVEEINNEWDAERQPSTDQVPNQDQPASNLEQADKQVNSYEEQLSKDGVNTEVDKRFQSAEKDAITPEADKRFQNTEKDTINPKTDKRFQNADLERPDKQVNSYENSLGNKSGINTTTDKRFQKGGIDFKKLKSDIEQYKNDNLAVQDGADIKINGQQISPAEAGKNADNANKALEALKDLKGDTAKSMQDMFNAKTPWQGVSQFLKEMMGMNTAIYKKVDNVIDKGKEKIENTIEKGKEQIENKLEKGKEAIENVEKELSGALKDTLGLGKEEIGSVLKEATEGINIKDTAGKALSFVSPAGMLMTVGKAIGENYADMAKEGLNNIQNILQKALDYGQIPEDMAKNLFSSAKNMTSLIDSVEKNDTKALNTLQAGYKEASTKIAKIPNMTQENIQNAKNELKEQYRTIGQEIKASSEFVKKGITNALNGVKNTISSIGNKVQVSRDTKSMVKMAEKVYQKEHAALALNIAHKKNTMNKLTNALEKTEKKLSKLKETYNSAQKLSAKNPLRKLAEKKMTNYENQINGFNDSLRYMQNDINNSVKNFNQTVKSHMHQLENMNLERKNVGLSPSKALDKAIEKMSKQHIPELSTGVER